MYGFSINPYGKHKKKTKSGNIFIDTIKVLHSERRRNESLKRARFSVFKVCLKVDYISPYNHITYF